MSQLIILEKDGKRQFEWSPEQPSSIEKAKRIFENKMADGYAAFRIFRSRTTVGNSGGALIQQQKLLGEQLQEFDSSADTIQMTPPMVGG
jgi:hypothetical protein